MAKPGELLRMAALMRARYAGKMGGPLPVPEERPDPKYVRPPQTAHANYSALMRRHDRVHTRHISAKGS